MLHYLLKELAPPITSSLRWYSFKYGWKGSYKSFEEAQEKCAGYDQDHILKRIIDTTLKVKNGEIPYERDGIPYDEVQMNFPLLKTLLYIASMNDNELTVIDFGGSLGTTYYQNYPYLKHLKKLRWCIIEQPKFVEAGKQQFENEHVKFYHTIEDCMKENDPQLFLVCNVLQYLDEPYRLLDEIRRTNIPYLMLDFMHYNDKDADRITIQHVPPVFYGIEASYPCRFFSRIKIEDKLCESYDKKYDYISAHEKYYVQLKPFRYEGALWELRK
ncbi:putative methyltransferase, LIC12133 family [Pedobacter westerhofensis]|uniref:Putative methyltransferase, LIC12133 family n=1 Tax=Pedobacter westerhofensis TaxID=425512 RepID=A0A521E829_9SPHI|nr:methyltransferase, TIGR04325 family [Pedobacter westerhofensis]SMO79581.1 putative methyltransferase, LIC12133 family [Pedobacter westerhofensis]